MEMIGCKLILMEEGFVPTYRGENDLRKISAWDVPKYLIKVTTGREVIIN